ncbi:M13 family metallopeptidase [Alteraurantiacibacter aestuarii]|uniref:M13 family peptidase n=1 Tax=Alteraurantiacibacter aestuarii TaxID=650004 RepID=A0A844ZMT6_9SPHN|nr:M13 family metallopeptidase [Alteraurantiacibacter aestuarii]MXO88396.1 M13 family peptidase [Alteraurantiacibacter aestuarii]
MIRKIFATGISAIALAAAMPALAQEAQEAPERATPAMSFGAWGVDLTQLDPSVDPGADFDAYVNGKWVAATEIPADRSGYGPFDILAEGAVDDVETLVTELVAADPAPGTTQRRIVDAYNAYADRPAIDAAGLAPAYPYLTQIFNAPDLDALAHLFEQPGYPAMVSAGVTVDSRDPNSYVVSVGFTGMGLDDRDYYLVDNERNLEIRAAYMDFLTFMLGKAGYGDPAAAARVVYDFEHQVAELEWDSQMFRIPELTYNVLSRDELIALAPDFPTETLLQSGGFGDVDRFLASQLLPDAEEAAALGLDDEQMGMMGGGLPAMMQLLTQTPLANLKAYMAVRFLSSYAAVLPSDIDDANFAFYGTVMSGQDSPRPREKRAIGEVEGLLGEQLGALYAARYFPPESKAQMDELVANLLRAMGEDLDDNDWLTPATLAEARAKLASFTPMIGYPDEFETYDGLEITPGNPLANRISAIAWNQADSLSRLGKPVDRTEWAMLPQTVNAYYMAIFNQVVFPAAILQAPYFNPNAEAAVNYGAIGAIIGHEIGHGFDDSGSRFDSTGTLRNWWQDVDRAGFEARAGKLIPLIEAYCTDDGETCLTGRLALGETLGDVVGLQMAYRAYRLSLNGAEAPVIDGLTGDQRFFLGFAQNWREKLRPERKRSQMLSDSHPPGDFRLNNTVRQLDAWYDAFDVGEDDPLYLPPQDRVSIW